MAGIRPAVSVLLAACLGLAVLPQGIAAAAEESAAFELEAEITWSAETAPFEFPDDPHLSGLIGATHNSRYVLFRDGDTASSGLELVAENGRVATLKAEFAEAKRRRRLGMVIDGPELKTAPGKIVARFEASAAHPLLSFVTMIAPSPDWFTGVAGVPLQQDGAWVESLELPLWAWDSGTDSGATYAAADRDQQPQQSVRLLASPHFLRESGLVPMGLVRIRRVRP